MAIDEGAVEALSSAGKSLLPVGVTGVSGSFPVGATVDVRTASGELVGRGIVGIDSGDLDERKGRRGGLPAIHRDDLVVFV